MKDFIKNVLILFMYLFFLGAFTFLIFTTTGTLKIIGLFVMILFCINRTVITIKDMFLETPSQFERYFDTFLAVLGIIIFYIVILMMYFESKNILSLLVSFLYLMLVAFIIYFIVKDMKSNNKNRSKK